MHLIYPFLFLQWPRLWRYPHDLNRANTSQEYRQYHRDWVKHSGAILIEVILVLPKQHLSWHVIQESDEYCLSYPAHEPEGHESHKPHKYLELNVFSKCDSVEYSWSIFLVCIEQ